MFDAYEAVDNIIDEINDNYNEACYEEIYNELCYRVESGEMSLEDAEIVNEAAYNKYVTELTVMSDDGIEVEMDNAAYNDMCSNEKHIKTNNNWKTGKEIIKDRGKNVAKRAAIAIAAMTIIINAEYRSKMNKAFKKYEQENPKVVPFNTLKKSAIPSEDGTKAVGWFTPSGDLVVSITKSKNPEIKVYDRYRKFADYYSNKAAFSIGKGTKGCKEWADSVING